MPAEATRMPRFAPRGPGRPAPLLRRMGAAAAAAVGALAVLALAAPRPAAAQDCPQRGALDARYCDRDGDLVADAPQNPREQADPSVLIFAYTPVEDPAVYRRVWDGFLEHLARVTGKRVQFFAVQNNAAQIEAMRAGRLHVAGYNTGATPVAVNCAGFVPVAMMASNAGAFGYEMEIVVQADGPLQRPEDLRGRTLAFTAPTSNSGYKAPAALLESLFGLRAERDYRPTFSGRHDNSVIGVANRDYDAAAVANSVMRRMILRNAVDGRRLRTIYRSQTFPTTAYGYAHTLRPELAGKIRQAFLTFPWQGSALATEFNRNTPPGERFIPITYREHWEVIRQIDQAMGVAYTCR